MRHVIVLALAGVALFATTRVDSLASTTRGDSLGSIGREAMANDPVSVGWSNVGLEMTMVIPETNRSNTRKQTAPVLQKNKRKKSYQ